MSNGGKNEKQIVASIPLLEQQSTESWKLGWHLSSFRWLNTILNFDRTHSVGASVFGVVLY